MVGGFAIRRGALWRTLGCPPPTPGSSQCGPPPPSVNIERSISITPSPRSRRRSVQLHGAGRRDHPLVAERDRVDAERERLLRAHPRSGRSPWPAATRRPPRAATSEQTAASFSASTGDQHVDVGRSAPGSAGRRASQPSLAETTPPAGSPPPPGFASLLRRSARCRAPRSSRRPPSSEPAVIIPRIGMSALLVEADDRCVLPSAPPLGRLGDDGPVRPHRARVAGEDLVRAAPDRAPGSGSGPPASS